jgi:nucleotide-binding universal stress UspA family protein
MNAFPTRILVATDGSEDAYLAVRAAIDLSQKAGSDLHAVHVWHDVPTPHARSFVRAQLRREAQEVLDKQVEKIEAAGGTVAEAHLREGRTIDEILDLSEELQVGLLIVGSRGLGGVKRILMGSVSEGIVHHARRPVLVMRGRENAWPPARVVVADDSSEDAKKAGELAWRALQRQVTHDRRWKAHLRGDVPAISHIAYRVPQRITPQVELQDQVMPKLPQSPLGARRDSARF